MVCKLTDDGYAEADKASKRIAAAFSEHPNWHSSDGELREARQEVTFALITVEDDLTKVTKTVEELFSLLRKGFQP